MLKPLATSEWEVNKAVERSLIRDATQHRGRVVCKRSSSQMAKNDLSFHKKKAERRELTPLRLPTKG